MTRLTTAATVGFSAVTMGFSLAAGATTYAIEGSASKNEHSCTWITAVFTNQDCTFANTIALLNPVSLLWSGPTRNGGYYERGGPGDDVNYNPNDASPPGPPLEPDTIKIEPTVIGSIIVDDSGTPANGSDDTVQLTFKIQGPTPIAGIARNISTGQFTRAVQRWQSMAHTMSAPYPVNAALPNMNGGFDYIIGSRGTPTRLCRALAPGVDETFDPDDCFPSNNYDKDNAQPAQPAWWAPKPSLANPNRVGIERSLALTNKPGPGTTAVPGSEIPNIGLVTEAVFEDPDPAVLEVLDNDLNLGTTGSNVVTISVAPNQGGTATVNADGTIQYLPALGFTGLETFSYQACFQGVCDTAQATVSVQRELLPTNDCEAVNLQSGLPTPECTTSPLILGGGEDPGFDNMVGIISTGNAGAVISADLYYTHEYNIGAFGGTGNNSYQAGNITFSGTDVGSGVAAFDDVFAAPARFRVTGGPRAIALDTRGKQGAAATGTATIPNSELGVTPTVITLNTTGTTGTCTVAANVITYTPANSFVAGGSTDTCDYTITDSEDESETGTVTATITDVQPSLPNGPPRDVNAGGTATADAAFTAGNGVVTQHTLAVTTQATAGSCAAAVIGANVRVTYSANDDASGSDSCVVTLTDADGDSANGTFTFDVQGGGISLPGGGSSVDPWSLLLLGGLPLLARRRRN